MHFALTEDQAAFRDAARALLEGECTPKLVRAAWDPAAPGRSKALWRKLAEVGLLGLSAPAELGGIEAGEVVLVAVLEECGRVALPEPVLETVAVGVPLLLASGARAMVERWVPRVAGGEAVLTVGVGPDPLVADAHVADLLLLAAGDALHAVDRSSVRLEAQPSVDGARRLFRVEWAPSRETLLCEGEAARAAIAEARDRGALAAAAILLGLARKTIDLAVEYARVRTQFGKPIGSFQAVKHHLVDALLPVEMARPVVLRAAWSMERRAGGRSLHASMAKAMASEAATTAAALALQCHGAIGYSFEYDLHLWMKRAWALAAAWGGADQHRARVAEAILEGNLDEHMEGFDA